MPDALSSLNISLLRYLHARFRLLIALALMAAFVPARAQMEAAGARSGFQAGLNIDLGTKLLRMGIFANAYYLIGNLQLNGTFRTQQGLNGYGPPGARSETQFSIGGIWGLGKKSDIVSPFFSCIDNRTGRNSGIGYSHNFYFDNIGSGQRTGTILLQFGSFLFATENDAFADGIMDRFRTGAILMAWTQGDTRIALNSLLWTGDPASKGRRNLNDARYPGRWGVVDLYDATYGRYSHGILSLQAQRLVAPGIVVRADAGIDHEMIRHILQNRFIHDLFFIPPRWVKVRNRHVPMLDREGRPFLFLPGQQLKPAQLFLKASMNPGGFW